MVEVIGSSPTAPTSKATAALKSAAVVLFVRSELRFSFYIAAYSIIYFANTVCNMKSTGIVRRVDVLGRIVIPKELRRMLKINEGDPMEIFVEREEIVLKKYSPLLNSDDLSNGIAQTLATRTGHTVLICDRDSFIAGNGSGVKDILSRRVSSAIGKL